MPPFLAPYLIGLVTAPLAKMVIKPIVRGTVKTTIGIALQMKKLAAEAAEDLQDLAAEAASGVAAAGPEMPPPSAAPKTGARVGVPVTTPKRS